MARVRLPSGQVLTIRSTAELARWQPALRRDYRRGEAACLCQRGKTLPLAVCRLNVDERTETFYLRAHPSSSRDHMRDCPFYTNGNGASTSRLAGAGPIRIEGGLRLRDLRTASETERSDRKPGSGGSSTPETALLQILRGLWLETGLHVWEPATARRSWHDIAQIVEAAAADIRTTDGRLSDILFVAAYGSDDLTHAGALRFQRMLARARTRRSRLLVIGELGAIDDVGPDRRAATLFIKGFPREVLRPLWSQTLIDLTRTRFTTAAALLRDRPAESRIVAIFTFEPHATDPVGFVHVLSLQATTRSFTPVDSTHELDVARALMALDRHFRKPLEAEDGCMPDFELLDCEHAPYPMEIFGMNTPEYLARRAEKIERYNRERPGHWWAWTPPEIMPPLPQVVQP